MGPTPATSSAHDTNGLHETNGVDGTNGYNHESSPNSRLTEKTPNPSGPLPPLAPAVHHPQLKADRKGIKEAFSQFAQLIHSPRRPLPTQNGYGTQSASKTQTGLRADIKYIGWKGTRSLLTK